MSVLTILTGTDNPILRRKTKKVFSVTKEVLKLLKDMEETMVKAEGLGIAAPQVGQSVRVCIAQIGGKRTALINPMITWRSKETWDAEEGCLSLPGIDVMVTRSVTITLTFQDTKGKTQERRLSEMDARIVQHELDHLEGVLIVDHLKKAEREERAETAGR